MIVYYLGLPGSGKSYAGVNLIYNNFSDNEDAKRDLKKDYHNCYTNINEFNFDLVHDVYKFEFDVFYDQLSELYRMYKTKCTDEEIIEKARDFNLYKTLFIIDEAHNIFDRPRPKLIWWLTYHRHLYHDIVLITQNIALVNTKYKPLAEAFYKAKASSLTLNKKYFNYMFYTDARMTKDSFVNTIKVKKRDSVFKLYKSGDSVESTNVVKKFIIIALLLIIPILIVGGYLKYHMAKEIAENGGTSNKIKRYTQISNDGNVSLSPRPYENDESIYMQVICNNNMCSYNSIYFDIRLLDFAYDNFNLKIIKSRRRFNEHIVSFVVNQKFKKFLGVSDEERTQNITTNINPFNIHK